MGRKAYTVRAGDSWEKIAGIMYGDQRMFGELMRANGQIAGGKLHPGMTIYLPDQRRNPLVTNAQAALVGIPQFAGKNAQLYQAPGATTVQYNPDGSVAGTAPLGGAPAGTFGPNTTGAGAASAGVGEPDYAKRQQILAMNSLRPFSPIHRASSYATPTTGKVTGASGGLLAGGPPPAPTAPTTPVNKNTGGYVPPQASIAARSPIYAGGNAYQRAQMSMAGIPGPTPAQQFGQAVGGFVQGIPQDLKNAYAYVAGRWNQGAVGRTIPGTPGTVSPYTQLMPFVNAMSEAATAAGQVGITNPQAPLPSGAVPVTQQQANAQVAQPTAAGPAYPTGYAGFTSFAPPAGASSASPPIGGSIINNQTTLPDNETALRLGTALANPSDTAAKANLPSVIGSFQITSIAQAGGMTPQEMTNYLVNLNYAQGADGNWYRAPVQGGAQTGAPAPVPLDTSLPNATWAEASSLSNVPLGYGGPTFNDFGFSTSGRRSQGKTQQGPGIIWSPSYGDNP